MVPVKKWPFQIILSPPENRDKVMTCTAIAEIDMANIICTFRFALLPSQLFKNVVRHKKQTHYKVESTRADTRLRSTSDLTGNVTMESSIGSAWSNHV